jgi:NAD(P)H-hydrate epimerase
VDAVLIGPGIGTSDDTMRVVMYVLKNYAGPIVLDADGINVMQQHKDILRDRAGQTVLTPHEGEFCRFTGEAICNRREDAEKLAKRLNAVVILKGHNTVVTDGNNTYINTTGNPGMAVGGCGDVLAGIVVSLLGQGVSPFEASVYATWLHGAAGDVCLKKMGQYGMLPTDMIDVLPRLMK